MDEIEQIASKVLGKTSDGKTMMRYETPDEVDKSLLVGIPRHLNRTQYNLTGAEFEGIDTWNSYEFSCLLDNGFPISGWLRWSYSSHSENIVESKSAKLYLNSFNMAKMGSTITAAIMNIEETVWNDMFEILECEDNSDLHVALHISEDAGYAKPMAGSWMQLEELIAVENIDFSHYNESPNILEVIESNGRVDRFMSNSLRSNCRVTNQPDWGDIYIHVKGDKTITPESLMQYIVSMRKENHFHEEICECVYKRLWDLLNPSELVVSCLYTRRGGIDINPIRASNAELLYSHLIANAYTLTSKTMRQ
jgi:7-cyano-7-deazaguanine reductase